MTLCCSSVATFQCSDTASGEQAGVGGKAGSRRVLAGSLSSSLYGIKGNVSGTTFVCAFQPGLWSESCQSGCKWEYAMEGWSGSLRDIYCLCGMEWQGKKRSRGKVMACK